MYHRFVNHLDIFADAPMHLMRHVAEPHTFHVDGELGFGFEFFQRVRDTVIAPVKHGAGVGLKVHSRDQYVEYLERLLAKNSK